jgi:branched-chain amino acid transport system substrate-binding protein
MAMREIKTGQKKNQPEAEEQENKQIESENQPENQPEAEEQKNQQEEPQEEPQEKKKHFALFAGLFSVLALIVIALVLFWQNGFFGFFPSSNKKPLYIAVSGPMSGKGEANGQAMVRGIQLYLDKINRQGGIHGHPVKLLTFDDQGQAELAEKKALEMAKNSKALAVIGHYGSSASIAAAPIYKKYGIPAVSGSSTADALTVDNDWYFRTIFNNSDQGALLANYVRKVLNYDEINIFFDEDAYGATLSAAFIQEAKLIGLDIKLQWHFNSADSFNQSLNNIVGRLGASPNKQTILFLATHSTEAVETLVALKQLEDVRVDIIGGDALSSTNFLKKLRQHPQEQINPGYYSNGVYTVSPLLFNLAGKRAQDFRDAFVKKYQEEPLVTSALYYDAATVVLHAMKSALEKGKTISFEETRQRIKEGLWHLASIKNAIEGVTSPLYFDKHGDIIKPIPIGVYKNGHAIAAMRQFQPLQSVQNIDNLLQDILENKIIEVNGQFMSLAQVVYAGIDFNEISELDPMDSIFTADLYLWFRFKGEFDDKNIEFVNLATDEVLDEPISVWHSSTEPGISTKTYRFKTQFKVKLNFREYPLDKQSLPIYFRHKELTKNQLIYVIDVQGMPSNKMGQSDGATNKFKFFSMGGWYVNKASFFQSTRVNDSTWGITDFFNNQQRIEFSQFNAIITISRHVVNNIIKTLLPVIFIVILGYIAFYLNEFSQQLAIGTNLILATSLFHLQLASTLPNINYTVLIEYFFYLAYLLAVFIIFIALFTYRHEESDNEKALQFVRRLYLAGRVIYPLALLTFVGVFVYQYYNNSNLF